jgi:hypothetical protein
LLDGVARSRGRAPALLRLGATLDLAEQSSDRQLAPEAALRGIARRGAAAACLGVQGWQPAAEWQRTAETGLAVMPLADWRQRGLTAAARAAVQALLRQADGLYINLAAKGYMSLAHTDRDLDDTLTIFSESLAALV